jgi:hypothetical protein
MSYKKPIQVFLISLGIGILPFFLAMLSELIASILGCTVNESKSHSCMIIGLDIGELLYAMFVAVWLFFISIPVGLLGILFSFSYFIYVFIKKTNSSRG